MEHVILKRYLQLSRIPFLRGHIKSNLITQLYRSRLESEMGNNSDFLSELLRINGLLQASLTELRYRCEVYRLSLRSICKVLGKVQKEHDLRLCGLTTSRYSYQTYLQNLSQKQALDRISNVVKKASTFINGYSLVDKDLFQPPPPKPKSMNQEKIRTTTQTTASCTSSFHLDLAHSDSDANSLNGSITSNGTYSNSEKIKSVADAACCKLNKTEVVRTRHLSEKHDRKTTSSKRSRSKERRKHCQTQGKNGSEHHRKRKTLRNGGNSTERDEPLPEKQTMSLSVSRQRCQLRNPRHQQNDTTSKLSQRWNYSSIRSQSQKTHSSTERKTCMVYASESMRAKSRHDRPSLEHKGRIFNNETQHDEKKSLRAAHLKEIHESCERRIRYNVREKFTPRSRTYTQAEKVRRIQLCKISESQHASRQTMTGIVK